VEIINSVAYSIWGKDMVNLVYSETWEHFGIDPMGFWICFGVSIALLTLVGWLTNKDISERMRRDEISS
jgi:hypothetical protein